MGAINPNKIINRKQLEVSQKLTRAFVSSASSYYEAHSIIENAVLAEENAKAVRKFVNDAKSKFKTSSVRIKELLHFINVAYEEFEGTNEWIEYLDELLIFAKRINNKLDELNILFSTKDVDVSISSKSFQDSMWGNNVNSDIRKASIECSTLFSDSMNLHCKFVESTHATIQGQKAA